MHDQTHQDTTAGTALGDVVPFLKDLPRLYPTLFPKPGTAVWLLRQRYANGLAPVVRFVGRRAFISRRDFDQWFRSRSGATRLKSTRSVGS